MLFPDILCNSHSSIIGTSSKGRRNGYFASRREAVGTFSHTTCIHEMVSKVHLTDDFSVKEAGINLKLTECMQNICINLNSRLHKDRLKCDFYWQLSHIQSKCFVQPFTEGGCIVTETPELLWKRGVVVPKYHECNYSSAWSCRNTHTQWSTSVAHTR